MVLLFCILLCTRPSSINRLDSGLQSSLCRTCGLGLGMGCSRYPHSIRRSGDGGTLLEYANRWWTILRQRCSGARWLGSSSVLGMSLPGNISFESYFLTLERVDHWLVQLPRPSYRTRVCQLCPGLDDSDRGRDRSANLYCADIPYLSSAISTTHP